MGGQSVSSLLQQQLGAAAHDYLLGPLQVQRSVAYAGPSTRLRSLLHRLRTGEQKQMQMVVLGGSISWGSAVKRGEDWFSRVVAYMRKAFPATNITAINGCEHEYGSAAAAVCM